MELPWIFHHKPSSYWGTPMAIETRHCRAVGQDEQSRQQGDLTKAVRKGRLTGAKWWDGDACNIQKGIWPSKNWIYKHPQLWKIRRPAGVFDWKVFFLFLFLACTCSFVLSLRVFASSESCPHPTHPAPRAPLPSTLLGIGGIGILLLLLLLLLLPSSPVLNR